MFVPRQQRTRVRRGAVAVLEPSQTLLTVRDGVADVPQRRRIARLAQAGGQLLDVPEHPVHPLELPRIAVVPQRFELRAVAAQLVAEHFELFRRLLERGRLAVEGVRIRRRHPCTHLVEGQVPDLARDREIGVPRHHLLSSVPGSMALRCSRRLLPSPCRRW